MQTLGPMVRLSWLPPLLALLALGGCRRAEGHSPGLSAEASGTTGSPFGAPSDSSSPLSSSSAASSEDAADPPPPPSTGPLVVDLHGKVTLPPPIPEDAPRLASIAMLTDVRAKPDAKATKVGALRAGAV